MKPHKLILVIPVVITVFLLFSSLGTIYHTHNEITTAKGNSNHYTTLSSVRMSNLNGSPSQNKYQEGPSAFGTTSSGKHYFNFTESGLPTGSSWAVTVDGSLIRYTGNDLSIRANSGTYINYTIHETLSYYPNVTSGSVKMPNSNVTVAIKYTHFSYITGTINPKNSSLSINGAFVNTKNGTFNLTVENGTFNLEAINTGFNTYYNNFTLSPGQTENLSINLTKASPSQPTYSPPPNQPYSNILIYVVTGAVAAIAILAGYAFVYRRGKN